MIPIRDDNPTARRAIVTILLIAVNIAIYFGVQYPKQSDANAEAVFEYRWAGVPCEVRTGKPIVLVPDGTITPVTACVIPAAGIAAPHELDIEPPPHAAVSLPWPLWARPSWRTASWTIRTSWTSRLC